MASNVAQGSTRLILIGAAVLLSIGMGLRQSIGLFLTPVTRDLALTAADFRLTIAIQNIVWGLAQAPAGAIADRFGLRVTLVAGTVIYITGLAAMAAAGGEMALIVSSVLIGIALACTASSLALAACARAVPERSRSKMLGVVAAIGSLGTLIVFVPAALGAVLNDATIPGLRCRVVCGGANNQLAEARHDAALAVRGIVFVPDYLANAGGVIDFHQETIDDQPAAVLASVARIGAITRGVLRCAAATGATPLSVADDIVRARIIRRA